jgi:hypothetical protein
VKPCLLPLSGSTALTFACARLRNLFRADRQSNGTADSLAVPRERTCSVSDGTPPSWKSQVSAFPSPLGRMILGEAPKHASTPRVRKGNA